MFQTARKKIQAIQETKQRLQESITFYTNLIFQLTNTTSEENLPDDRRETLELRIQRQTLVVEGLNRRVRRNNEQTKS